MGFGHKLLSNLDEDPISKSAKPKSASLWDTLHRDVSIILTRNIEPAVAGSVLALVTK